LEVRFGMAQSSTFFGIQPIAPVRILAQVSKRRRRAASHRPGRSTNKKRALLWSIDSAGQKLAYVYYENEPGARRPSCYCAEPKAHQFDVRFRG
jgi:hypothetical protein